MPNKHSAALPPLLWASARMPVICSLTLCDPLGSSCQLKHPTLPQPLASRISARLKEGCAGVLVRHRE